MRRSWGTFYSREGSRDDKGEGEQCCCGDKGL
jgi:hypothetical protein